MPEELYTIFIILNFHLCNSYVNFVLSSNEKFCFIFMVFGYQATLSHIKNNNCKVKKNFVD